MKPVYAACAAAVLFVVGLAGCGGVKPASVSSVRSSATFAQSNSVPEVSPGGQPAPASSAVPDISASSASVSSHSVSAAPQRKTVQLTFPEGYTVGRIGAALESAGVCSKTAFFAAVNSFNCQPYSFVFSSLSYNPNEQCYKLEGYLYPDTYAFYKPSTPSEVLAKIVANTEQHLRSNAASYQYSGMSAGQLVTLASVIQKETASYDDMRNVSCVFHNRIRQGMALQSEATRNYAKYGVPSNLVDQYKYYYNTVTRCKFPSGPICNPGANALRAAADPTNANYLYFCSDTSGHYYFAATYAEQLQNIKAHPAASSPETSSQT